MTDASPGTAANPLARLPGVAPHLRAVGGRSAAPPAAIRRQARRGLHRPDLLICLSHLRWDFVFQRPQHLLSRAARDRDVVFVEEPIFGADVTTPRMERHGTPQGVTVAVPRLPEGLPPEAVIAAQRVLLDELATSLGAASRGVIAWFYTPMAMEFADRLEADLTVYDCMDELSLFRGASPRLVALEQALLDRADLVFTGGRSLYEAKRDRHRSVHCFPSSIDATHFRAARDPGSAAADLAGIPHPRIGFFGVIDERMDLDLVDALAAARLDWSLVMVGPVVKIDPTSLPRRANIHWLGGRRYAELPALLAGWDAGFMPFALNESTRFISPTKTPEFLAAGLPLVSTPITDVVRDWGPQGAGLVAIAGDAEGFARAIADMLAETDRAAWIARVDQALAGQSWDRTWAAMSALIERALPIVAAAPMLQGVR